MYGLESTVLIAWHTGNAFSATHPFYPADIAAALAQVPAPCVLVSTPVHLRALLDGETALPEIHRVLSATAPLTTRLAQEVEAHCQTQLVEIYGSTETGAIASRHTTQTAPWHLFPGARLHSEGDRTRAEGALVEPPILLNDVIESLDDEHFLLARTPRRPDQHRRQTAFTGQPQPHPQQPFPVCAMAPSTCPNEADRQRVTRLAACVVAPELDASRLLAALRERIDPVFLPRPLVFLESLPRNSTGKLPRQALENLFHKTANPAS